MFKNTVMFLCRDIQVHNFIKAKFAEVQSYGESKLQRESVPESTEQTQNKYNKLYCCVSVEGERFLLTRYIQDNLVSANNQNFQTNLDFPRINAFFLNKRWNKT